MSMLLSISFLLFSIGPYFDGSFYPKSDKEITDFLTSVFEKTKDNRKIFESIGAIVPHAGYVYSASVAANVYRSIPQYDVYFIISPSHRHWFENAIVCDERFKTPLGEIETEKEIINRLKSSKDLFINDCNKFIGEHAIEVQLPFLQHRFKDRFKIVPLLINTTNQEKILRISKAIKDALDSYNKKAFYIISSDLSHYPEYDSAKIVDLTFIEAIKRMDTFYINLTSKILLSKEIERYQTSACGLGAILLGVEIAKNYGYNRFELIEYKNSYDTNPKFADKDAVVGYMAGIFVKGKEEIENKLSSQDKKVLLNIARRSIEDAFENRELNPRKIYKNIQFNLPQAVFVTLTQNGNLRGCMGTTDPRLSLGDAVEYFARVAAFEDPRFKPLSKEEIKKTKIEISILSPLRKVKDHTYIKEKKNGVVIVSKKGSGLFLPQVWEHFHTKEEFLSELCSQKAGLPPTCWKSDDVEIYVFDVEKFSE